MTESADRSARWIKIAVNEEALDIQSMREMDAAFYAAYLEDTLFFVDHHDILRAQLGEYPIATSEKQIRALIQYLEGVARRMKEAE
jgi:hypothetical protein